MNDNPTRKATSSLPDPAMAVMSKVFAKRADEAENPFEKAYNRNLAKKAMEVARR